LKDNAVHGGGVFKRKTQECSVAEKEKKVARAPVKENFFTRLADSVRKYIRETIGELRKVTWPTRKEATNLTYIVLMVITATTIFLWALDLIYTQLFKLILKV
jgi:preprotein translocase subunit SecE